MEKIVRKNTYLANDKSVFAMVMRLCIIVVFWGFMARVSHAQNKEQYFDENSTSYTKMTSDEKFDFLVKKYIDAYYTDVEKASYFVSKITELAEITRKPKHLFTSVYTQSKIAFLKSDYDKSLQLLKKSLEIARKNKDTESIIKCYNSMGVLYKAKENYKEALSCYIKALKLLEKNPDANIREMSHVLNNIANIFSFLGNITEAINYLRKGIKLNKEEKNNIVYYINFGLNFSELKEYDSAYYYLIKSYQISKKYDNKLYESISLGALADLLAKQQYYYNALNYYLQALKLQKEIGIKEELLDTYVRVITTYLYLKEDEKADEYIKKYKLLFGKESSKNSLMNLLFQQAKYYEQKEDYKNAYESYKEYMKLKDSLQNNEVKIQIQRIQSNYESEKKQREINQLKAERLQKELEVERKQREIMLLRATNQLQKQELEKNRLITENNKNKIELLNNEKWIQQINLENKKKLLRKTRLSQWIILIASILVFIPMLVALVMFRQKIRSQRLVSLQKEKINIQRFKEIEKNKQLSVLQSKLTGQHIERKRIAKELHDGLGGNLAGIKVRLLKVLQNHRSFELQDIILKIDTTCDEIRSISHDLVPPSIKNENFVNLLKKYVHNIAQNQNWEVEFECFPENEINSLSKKLKLEIYRIIQEIITNIHKHAHTKSIDFQLVFHGDYINILIEDFGKGFNEKEVKKGLGINNIKERVMLLSGKTKIDSIKGRGTIVNIIIPVKSKKNE